MKLVPFQITPDSTYKLDAFPAGDLSRFVPVEDCPACAARGTFDLLMRLGGKTADQALNLVCCRDCGHVTYDRSPSDAWLDHFYSSVFDRIQRVRPPEEIKLHVTPVPPWGFPWQHFQSLQLPQRARILDFGCGYGNGLLYLQKLGYTDTYGVEMGSTRVAVGQRHFPGRVFQGSVPEAKRLAAEHGRFDAIIMHHVTEHLRAPADVVSALTPLLAPGGVLVIAVPEVTSESPLLFPLYLGHLHHFNTTSLLRMLRRLGLRAFRWRGSTSQLAVVGTADPNWTPPADYSDEELPVTPEFLARVSRYVRAPYEGTDGSTYLCYFHPAFNERNQAGFQRLDPRLSLWMRAGQATVFPLMQRSPVRRGYGAFLRLTRRVFGDDAVVGTEFIGFRTVDRSNGSGDIPWLAMANGDVPVLVK
jgi:2-polyprenyl-3-methyl-5-hydroxy-6-metoxy-1,4-benzoquinol methylase